MFQLTHLVYEYWIRTHRCACTGLVVAREAGSIYVTLCNQEIGFSRLRFRFVCAVHAVRASEAMPVGGCRMLSRSQGLLGARIDVLSGALGTNILCAGAWVLTEWQGFLSRERVC